MLPSIFCICILFNIYICVSHICIDKNDYYCVVLMYSDDIELYLELGT